MTEVEEPPFPDLLRKVADNMAVQGYHTVSVLMERAAAEIERLESALVGALPGVERMGDHLRDARASLDRADHAVMAAKAATAAEIERQEAERSR